MISCHHPGLRIHQRTAISTIITKPAALLQMTYEWPNRLYWQGFQPLILWLHLAKIHFTNALYQVVNYSFFQLSNACWRFLRIYGTIFTLCQMFYIHWMLVSFDFTVLVLCLSCLIDASAKAKHVKSSMKLLAKLVMAKRTLLGLSHRIMHFLIN